MKSNSMENMQKQFFCSCGRKNKAIYNKPSAKKMVETCPNPRTYITLIGMSYESKENAHL